MAKLTDVRDSIAHSFLHVFALLRFHIVKYIYNIYKIYTYIFKFFKDFLNSAITIF